MFSSTTNLDIPKFKWQMKIVSILHTPMLIKYFFNVTLLNLLLKLLSIWHMQNTWCACGDCHSMWGLFTDSIMLRCQSDIKHKPCCCVTCTRMQDKNQLQAFLVFPFTMANASDNGFLFPSCVVTINNLWWYFPYKWIPSTWTMGLQNRSPSMHGLNAKNKRKRTCFERSTWLCST